MFIISKLQIFCNNLSICWQLYQDKISENHSISSKCWYKWTLFRAFNLF